MIKFLGQFKKEVKRFCKVPYQTIGNPAISVTLYLLIFGLSLGEAIQLNGYSSYLTFLIPGLITMSTLRNCFENSTSAIVGSKYVGELQDIRVGPLSPFHIAWAKSCGSLIRGLIVALITYLIGTTFYFVQTGTLLHIKEPFWMLYFLIVGGLAFANLGVSIGMYARSFDQVGGISTFILLPLIYLGGVFFPLDRLHPFWETLSYGNPIFYMINGMRHAMLGKGDVSLLLSAGLTLVFFFIFHFIALRSLSHGRQYYR
ncbi:MAG: Inner membrane transport permease YadH [Chlamydiia bacterium]|nr:Inner membrane transport permease YadH [Chlamydiia bacterium]MCH9615494.1 Inner membrane transport permease YadH [Chlamydiia bacterium]MCH9629149.1 Inner membrane transport permease YadH [Chlamydiia bacterium]